MRVAVASDHAGFALKQALVERLGEAGHAVSDLGTDSEEPVDYPDYAAAVGRAVQEGKAERAILVCGSGAGAAIAANKLRGIRAAMVADSYTAHQCVEHDDANVMALASRVIGKELAWELVTVFLAARFSGEERHVRRLDKVKAMEA
ncbi:MAG: ribose 5-phosphate isomerase B [Acidimicrobiia bacterium]